METSSGCSIIDLGTLQNLGLDNAVGKNFPKTLINASGDTMKILGAFEIEVSLTGCPPCRHTLQVLDSVTHSNILLGRDFMHSYGSVQFDFTKNKIRLGSHSISGLSSNTTGVPLCQSTVIPPRFEKIVLVKSSTRNSLLQGDFEPKVRPAVRGLHATRSRVIPNITVHSKYLFLTYHRQKSH